MRPRKDARTIGEADFLIASTVQGTSPSHIQGVRECVRAQGRIAPNSRLRYAALCVMVRQENYLALTNMCPIGWDLDAFSIPKDPEPWDELSWTMLVVRLCADLVQFSNEVRSKQHSERWEHLKAMNEQWKLTKPKSFEAVFTKEADRAHDEPFPKSWFLQVWHSTWKTSVLWSVARNNKVTTFRHFHPTLSFELCPSRRKQSERAKIWSRTSRSLSQRRGMPISRICFLYVKSDPPVL